MSTSEARVWEMVDRSARAVTDPTTGRFENKELVAALIGELEAEDLPPHVRGATVEMQAKLLASQFVRRRNPKPRQQGTLFHPAAILPLGDGKRIWMEYATDTDLIEWARLSTANLARVAHAEGTKQGYVADRLAPMREHPEWTLGRVEREVFGYVETADPDEGDFEGEPDEDAS